MSQAVAFSVRLTLRFDQVKKKIFAHQSDAGAEQTRDSRCSVGLFVTPMHMGLGGEGEGKGKSEMIERLKTDVARLQDSGIIT